MKNRKNKVKKIILNLHKKVYPYEDDKYEYISDEESIEIMNEIKDAEEHPDSLISWDEMLESLNIKEDELND